MVAELSRGRRGGDRAVEQQQRSGADSEGLGHVVVRKENSGASPGHLAEEVAEATGGDRIDPGERLIAHEDPWVACEGPRKLQSTTFTRREGTGADIQAVIKTHARGLGRCVRRWKFGDLLECAEVLAHRQVP